MGCQGRNKFHYFYEVRCAAHKLSNNPASASQWASSFLLLQIHSERIDYNMKPLEQYLGENPEEKPAFALPRQGYHITNRMVEELSASLQTNAVQKHRS